MDEARATVASGNEPFPRRILQTWKTHALPPRFAAWRQTWLALHPNYEHFLWSDADNRAFVRRKFPEYLAVYDRYPREIERVDAVRYMFLYDQGGLYADLDQEALRSFDPLLERHQEADVVLGCLGHAPGAEHHAIPNSLMISKPKADFWKFVLAEMVRRAPGSGHGTDPVLDAVEYKTGPVLLTDCATRYRGASRITILEPEAFYPINWASMEPMHQPLRQQIVYGGAHLPNSEAKKLFPNSWTVAYWTHTW